ncbi:MAG: aminodeoxychorismate synthase component I [bacterium]
MTDPLSTLDLPARPEGVLELDCGPSRVPPEQLFPLLAGGPHAGLLLSGGCHPLSRFSFIGLDPFLVLTSRGRQIMLELPPEGRTGKVEGDPFEILRSVLDLCRLREAPAPGAPPFRAGGIGYLSYELGRHIERLPATTLDDLELPELYFAFYRTILCHDRESSSYKLFCLQQPGRPDALQAQAPAWRGRISRLLESAARKRGRYRRSDLAPDLQSDFTKLDYLAAVRRALDYIREGDIYQVNLSQRFRGRYSGDSYGLFLKLFEINPAPFFAYLDPGPFQVICSSPERFFKVEAGRVETRPIKGTLPRGSTADQDARYRQELLRSAKNLAELAMITDLLRNDLGRVCAYGSVRVEDFPRLEAYTNVFHLVSIVSGTLAPGRNGIDLLRAAFPGGSITGCPKIRSMEIIDELEPTARSVYTGAIGYVGFDGSMDLNVAIRTLIRKGGEIFYQVGGGIVFDSDPESEYEETLHKAASIRDAVLATAPGRRRDNP